MRVLVTGGAGFIGSELVRQLVAAGTFDVINLDALTYAGNLQSLRSIEKHPRYTFLKVDLRDAEAVERAVSAHEPDWIMHLAAESHVDRSISGPKAFLDTNVIGTFNLLQAAHQLYERLPGERKARFRFHHVSTDEVYGTLGAEGKFTETTAYAPNSPYSATKASSDLLVRAWHHTFGLPTVTTNCSNNYGPYQFPEKLIPVMILNALQGKKLPVYGDGKNVRDWLFVGDHARALRLVVEKGRLGETYNVGGENEVANIDVVGTLCSILDEALPDAPHRPHKSLISFVTDRPGHDFRYAVDISKIKAELGWHPQETFASGLRKTVHWYLANEAWWRAIQDGSYRSTGAQG